MRIATYNVEWFNNLFDDRGRLMGDDGWSGRQNVTRIQQIEALGIVFTALNADAIMVVEAPDQNGRRATVPALENFAQMFELRARKALMGFPNETQQEIALLYDPDVLTAWHDPLGDPTGKKGSERCPRFDGVFRIDLDIDDTEDLVRFSNLARRALQDYLQVRATLDGASGRPLPSLPVFARHDKGAGDKVKPITPTTGRNIVKQRVRECLGPEAVGTITPHSFRHYFVTTVLLGSGGNLKLAQELARHQNIAVTQRYAHLTDDELDRGYYEIFENRR